METTNDKTFEYIALLEKTNDELLNTLKQYVKLLASFEDMVPDPNGWQDLMELFNRTIEAGERLVGEERIH